MLSGGRGLDVPALDLSLAFSIRVIEVFLKNFYVDFPIRENAFLDKNISFQLVFIIL